MFSFDKSSYEQKLMHVLQDKFFKTVKRNKNIAKWAGGRLGYTGIELNKYVRNIIFSYLMVPNDRKLVERILTDFRKAGIPINKDEICQKIMRVETHVQNKREQAGVGD
jgi:hypothetical protein